MAIKEHLNMVRGSELWNQWRKDNPDVRPDLSWGNWDGKLFIGVESSPYDFSRADLSRTSFINANLSRTIFIEANLGMANLEGAVLSEAVLSGANLRGTNLRRVSSLNADFRKASLRGTNLQQADLRAADFRESWLWGADFTGAKLSGADFEGAVYDANTLWPSDFRLESLSIQVPKRHSDIIVSSQVLDAGVGRARLERELERLKDRYDLLTQRLTAIEKDIDRTLDFSSRQLLKKNRDMWAVERNEVVSEMERIEKLL